MTDPLTTKRLTLRPLVPSDAPDIARHANDYEVTRWLTQLPNPYTLADAEAFIARQSGPGTFGICLPGEVIGCIGTKGEFGYWLGRAHWGQGYATEASRAVLAWHFGLGLGPLTSGHAVENTRSRAVLLKLGFRDTEIVDRAHKLTGTVRRQQVMELTAEDWRQAA